MLQANGVIPSDPAPSAPHVQGGSSSAKRKAGTNQDSSDDADAEERALLVCPFAPPDPPPPQRRLCAIPTSTTIHLSFPFLFLEYTTLPDVTL